MIMLKIACLENFGSERDKGGVGGISPLPPSVSPPLYAADENDRETNWARCPRFVFWISRLFPNLAPHERIDLDKIFRTIDFFIFDVFINTSVAGEFSWRISRKIHVLYAVHVVSHGIERAIILSRLEKFVVWFEGYRFISLEDAFSVIRVKDKKRRIREFWATNPPLVEVKKTLYKVTLYNRLL